MGWEYFEPARTLIAVNLLTTWLLATFTCALHLRPLLNVLFIQAPSARREGQTAPYNGQSHAVTNRTKPTLLHTNMFCTRIPCRYYCRIQYAYKKFQVHILYPSYCRNQYFVPTINLKYNKVPRTLLATRISYSYSIQRFYRQQYVSTYSDVNLNI